MNIPMAHGTESRAGLLGGRGIELDEAQRVSSASTPRAGFLGSGRGHGAPWVLLRGLQLALVFALVGLVSGGAPAFGALTRQYISQLTGAGTLSESFESPIGVAVDRSMECVGRRSWGGMRSLSLIPAVPSFANSPMRAKNSREVVREVVAVGDSTGLLYVTGNRSEAAKELKVIDEATGAFVEKWGKRSLAKRI